MKLSSKLISHNSGGDSILVSTGEADSSGIIKGNKTAGFIYDCLKKETTREKIIESMKAVYDAPEQVIAADVDKALATLCSIGAIG